MTPQELISIRDEIGFDNKAMALSVGIVRTTFNRYLDGTAQIPPVVERNVYALRKNDREYMTKRYGKGGEFDKFMENVPRFYSDPISSE